VSAQFVDGAIAVDDDWVDQLGHGTAAAATIKGHAPEAELYSIRIFRRRLEAHPESLLFAIDWAAEHGLDLLNLSLGCTDLGREPEFGASCERARTSGLVIVSASHVAGAPCLPGKLDGVIAVDSDPDLTGAEMRFEDDVVIASHWARPLEELPKERNFSGVSLAIANVTGVAAALLARGLRIR